jgi:hypothetical protein
MAMKDIKSFGIGDHRIKKVARAGGLAFLQECKGPIVQIDKEKFVIEMKGEKMLVWLKLCNPAHLLTHQLHWTAINPIHLNRFIEDANARSLKPVIVFVSADSARQAREALAGGKGVYVIPRTATYWAVSAHAVRQFLSGKPLTGAGLNHVWIIKTGSSDSLSAEGGTSPGHYVGIDKGKRIHIPTELADWLNENDANGVFDHDRPHKTPRKVKVRLSRTPLMPGTVLKVDLMVGGLKVVGTLSVSAAA